MKRINATLLNVATAALACIMAPAFTSCSEETTEPAVPEAVDALSINGNCDIYEIGSKEAAAWTVKSAPAWITPVKAEGGAGDKLQIYVESNIRDTREGEIVIEYKNGKSRSVAVTQSDEQTSFSVQRTYAVGWSFDVRTYMDFRGLKEQVFNTQKLLNFNPLSYRISHETDSDIDYFYGEDASKLASSMSGQLGINGKFNTFNLELQGAFGKSALSDSKRIFARLRSFYQECSVWLEQVDFMVAQDENLFTADFAAEREKVIKSGGSDEAIRHLIDHYGTHVVTDATLGGFYDYYFSSVVESSTENLNIKGAVELGFSKKFNLKASGNFENDLSRLNTERIEKFSVKGGDPISFTLAVESGTVNENTAEAWLATVREGKKYELLSFAVTEIAMYFPDDIQEKIKAYTDRMYYREVPVTRSENN